MANVVIMPKQGQSVESCIVTEFKKKVGDKVAVGDVLFSYETDKATFEEEAKVEGTVLACFFNDGDEIPVLTNVMVIGEPGESFAEFAPQADVAPVASAEAPAAVEEEKPAREEVLATAPLIAGAPVSPRARRLAEEKGVDTSHVAGSGPQGRIIARDILAAAAKGGRLTGKARAMMAEGGLEAPSWGSGLAGSVRAADLREASVSQASLAGEGSDFEVVKMSNMRKLIARSMYNSLQNSAQLTHHLGADARRLLALRKKAKKAYEEGRLGANVTINDLVCYATVKALQKFPNANSHCLGDAMRLFKKVHLGLAVDTERGLMVPAVKNADEMDIVQLSNALKAVAEDCKKGGINPDLLSPEAASFTVSNLGNYGVEMFTPIINLPQSAILGVNTIVPRPKDTGEGVYEFVPYVGLSLTYDHRALDGGEATRFVKQIAIEIENLDIDF